MVMDSAYTLAYYWSIRVLSPILFSLYIDGLLQKLRHQGLGCHVGGTWMGAAGYADDLALKAPSRQSMVKML